MTTNRITLKPMRAATPQSPLTAKVKGICEVRTTQYYCEVELLFLPLISDARWCLHCKRLIQR